MIASLDAGYSKPLKCLNKHDRTSAYIAAIVLNPSIKWTLFTVEARSIVEIAGKALITMWRGDDNHSTGVSILTVANSEDTDDENSPFIYS